MRLLVCDDHPVVRAGMVALLSSQRDFKVVGQASDGMEAVTLANDLEPDLVLLDIQMPNLDGIGALIQIKQHNPEIQILILSTYDTEAAIIRAIENGAQGFLLKDAPPPELFEAIRSLASGNTPLAGKAAGVLVQHVSGTSNPLNEREIEIIELMARGQSNKKIADQLFIKEDTVKWHVKQVLEKLKVSSRTEAVVETISRGYLDIGR